MPTTAVNDMQYLLYIIVYRLLTHIYLLSLNINSNQILVDGNIRLFLYFLKKAKILYLIMESALACSLLLAGNKAYWENQG